jgi:hypothetical protein
MESVYNIHPLSITKIKKVCDYQYDFLLNEYCDVYYHLVNTLESYQLKNLYRFIYLRILKINLKFKEISPIPLKKSITDEDFNIIIKEFIDNEPIREIIIMNSIQIYF